MTFGQSLLCKGRRDYDKKEEHVEEKADTVTHEEKVKPLWFLLLDKLFYFSMCSRGVNVSYSGDIFLKEMFSSSSHIHEA